MGQINQKSGRRYLYTIRTSIAQGSVRRVIYHHPIVGRESSRFLVDPVCVRRVGGRDLPCPPEYADRAELNSRGFTVGTDADGNEGSNIYCRTRKATRAATLWLREGIRKSMGWPEPTKYPDDSAPDHVKVAHYAEVVCGILTMESQAHRGVWDLEDGTVVIFGNDASPKDRRYEHEVHMLRRILAEVRRAEVLGYAVSGDGESWAMLIRRLDSELSNESFADFLRMILQDAWSDACQIALL